MKTAILRNESNVEIIEQETPKACGDFAVVRVHTAPMCTEFYKYRDGEPDLCLGHFWCGMAPVLKALNLKSLLTQTSSSLM